MNPSAMYNTTAQVRVLTVVADGIGGATSTHTDGTAFPCRIRQLNAREQRVSGTTDQFYTHRLYCDSSVSISEENQIVSGGVVYEVASINAYPAFLQVDMWRVNR